MAGKGEVAGAACCGVGLVAGGLVTDWYLEVVPLEGRFRRLGASACGGVLYMIKDRWSPSDARSIQQLPCAANGLDFILPIKETTHSSVRINSIATFLLRMEVLACAGLGDDGGGMSISG